jgi:ParB-like chromosome segregation protein Spo0J
MASPVKLSIRIACEGARTLPIATLKEFQGELKSLSADNFERLKKEIIERGFSAPFFVWQNDQTNYLLDGHQRFRTLKAMAKEGYEIPDLPVVLIDAKNKKEAKHKLLSYASQYGKIETQGLYEFSGDADFTLEELKDNFSFPDVDFEKFEAEFFDLNYDDVKDAGESYKPKCHACGK